GFIDDSSALDLRGAGIVISGFGVAAPTSNTIERCYIGTDSTGNAAGPNTPNNVNGGIILEDGASNNTIQNNVISSNGSGAFAGTGIYLYTPTGGGGAQQNNTITNNMIGVNLAGTAALPNAKHGVFVYNNSSNNTIGPGNVISGNGTNVGIQP